MILLTHSQTVPCGEIHVHDALPHQVPHSIAHLSHELERLSKCESLKKKSQ